MEDRPASQRDGRNLPLCDAKKSKTIARELVEKTTSGGINVEVECQLFALEEKLGSKAALLRKLDEEILDLTIEVDEDKFEEEVLSADVYDEDVSCALRRSPASFAIVRPPALAQRSVWIRKRRQFFRPPALVQRRAFGSEKRRQFLRPPAPAQRSE